MKNHIRIGGTLLQTNKKWSHLKESQKAWIRETAKHEYNRFITERGKLPVHGSKKGLIEHIYDRVEKRGIWVPFFEVSRVLSKDLARWNRRHESTQAELGAQKITPDDTSSKE